MRELLELKADVEQLRTAFGNSIRVGPVAAVDAEKGYRIRLGEGEGGAPFLSPWLPHPETGKTSVPLKIGQIVGIVAASGDLRQGLVFRSGYGSGHATPNADMEADVFEDAGVRLELKDGTLHVAAAGRVQIKTPHAVVNADRVDLGGEGGARVARIGDRVNVGSGSSRGLWPIVTGSSRVSAVD